MGDPPVGVNALSIPPHKASDGERVTGVVQSRAPCASFRRPGQASAQPAEGHPHRCVRQARVLIRTEEGRRTRRDAVPFEDVATQWDECSRMQRDQAELAEFPVAYGQYAVGEIDIGVIESERFGDPKARCEKQSEERAVGPRSQSLPRPEPGAGLEQRLHLGGRVHVGWLAPNAAAK